MQATSPQQTRSLDGALIRVGAVGGYAPLVVDLLRSIDGQENPYDTIRSAKINEVQKYMTIWNYCYDPIILSVSDKTWKKLTDDEKKIFTEAAKNACKKQVEESRKLDASIIKQFKDGGMQVNELSPESINSMKEVMKPVYEKYKEKFGADTFAAFGYKF